MDRGSVCSDEEFSGNVVEEDKGEWLDRKATEGGGKEEEVTGVKRGKMEPPSKGGEEVEVVLEVRGEEEWLGKGVEGGVGHDKGVIEVWESGGGDVVAKEQLTLSFDDWEFVIAGVSGGAMEVVVDTESTGEGWCGDCAVIIMDIAWDRICCDGLRGVVPSSVCEGGRRDGGGRRMVVEADAAFVCTHTEFVDDGHVAGDCEIVLYIGVE